MTIRGNSVNVISFPDGILNIESIYFLDRYAYIAASSCHGGLYRCELSTNVVEKVHSNSAEGARSATEVNRICSFKGKIVMILFQLFHDNDFYLFYNNKTEILYYPLT